ncbi:hypothetical protein BC830DRAFT_1118366 [Chytriomyces sp. MP71]|nr:hypothetical protein BC830DRAFT_1118366 [Chytriomyces sp. MP71]
MTETRLQITNDSLFRELLVTPTKTVTDEPLLEGDAAVKLVGNTDQGADMVLTPQNGELIVAHSRYLMRNSYFASHIEFQGLATPNDEARMKLVKLLVPFPNAFRFALEQIYSNDQNFYKDNLSAARFVPIFMNAQYFQIEWLILGCTHWFKENWKSIIAQPPFSIYHVDEVSIEKLLANFQDASVKFEIMLGWTRDCTDTDCLPSTRAFVEKNVCFNAIHENQFLDLCNQYQATAEFCVNFKNVCLFLTKMRASYEGMKKAYEKIDNKYDRVKIKCQECAQFFNVYDFNKRCPTGRYRTDHRSDTVEL